VLSANRLLGQQFTLLGLARIKANGNFNVASLEQLHSVSGLGINGVLSPSDAFDLESPLNWMLQTMFSCSWTTCHVTGVKLTLRG